MSDVIIRWAPIELRIPEVLRVVDRRDPVARQVSSLCGLGFGERVVRVKGIAVREAFPKSRLQAVIDHRLRAVDVIAAGGAKRRVRPGAGLPIERYGQRPVKRKRSPVSAYEPDLDGH